MVDRIQKLHLFKASLEGELVHNSYIQGHSWGSKVAIPTEEQSKTRNLTPLDATKLWIMKEKHSLFECKRYGMEKSKFPSALLDK